jgi:hypothetical protein
MKKILIVMCMPLYGSHISINTEKEEFVEKRLIMMKAQLAEKLRQILMVNRSSGKAEQLNMEIAQLKKNIPVTENSLEALKGK